MKPYLDFSEYLKAAFPMTKVQKISINAGLSCPNRDGIDGLKGGCTYCNNRSFSPAYTLRGDSVRQQVEDGIAFFRRKYAAMKFIAYFQSYTNTYGERDRLITLYEEALRNPEVVGLFVGTRPDCISDELLDYFASLQSRCRVFLEYGVESTQNATLERVRRGHTFEVSADAVRRTSERGIPCGVHLIIGLPGETEEDFLLHIRRINRLPVTSLKMHHLQILRGTALGRDYLAAPPEERMKVFGLDEYIRTAVLLLRHLRPDIYVDRFTAQSPGELLLEPVWNLKNYLFTEKLIAYMEENGFRQGDLTS